MVPPLLLTASALPSPTTPSATTMSDAAASSIWRGPSTLVRDQQRASAAGRGMMANRRLARGRLVVRGDCPLHEGDTEAAWHGKKGEASRAALQQPAALASTLLRTRGWGE
jgi:hypothetical protein